MDTGVTWRTILEDSSVRKCTIDGVEYVSVYDALNMICNSSKVPWKRFKTSYKCDESMFGTHKFPGQGQRTTPVVKLSHLQQFLHQIVTHMRLSLHVKQSFLDIAGDQSMFMRTYTEVEIHEYLKVMFARYTPQLQYPVKVEDVTYRIDFYIATPSLAIECDEYNHKHYNVDFERKRTDDVTAILNCKWIRYDPYDHDFNIFKLAARIVDALTCTTE